jgi:glycosyltransferase involved in cell wall biosynthesis
MAWALKRLCGIPFIFDMRGFFAEERVEGGLWLQGAPLYRIAKLVEGRLLAEADQIVSLSEAGREVLADWAHWGGFELPPVHVIPTCVECDRFRPSQGPNRGPDGALSFIYLGSLGTWYMLDEMLAFFRVFRRLKHEARFTFLTPASPKAIYKAASALGMDGSVVLAKEVPYEAVPKIIQDAHVSVFFIRPVSSKRASCPTKMGESLACGLPVVINPGVGDTEAIVRKERVGVVVQAWTEEAYDQAARELLTLLDEGPSLRRRCREVALRHFSLELGLERFERIYARYGLEATSPTLA